MNAVPWGSNTVSPLCAKTATASLRPCVRNIHCLENADFLMPFTAIAAQETGIIARSRAPTTTQWLTAASVRDHYRPSAVRKARGTAGPLLRRAADRAPSA